MSIETTLQEFSDRLDKMETETQKKKNSFLDLLKKVSPLIQIIILLGGVIVGYVKLQDRVDANELDRAKDYKQTHEQMIELKQDIKELQYDIKQLIKTQK